MILTAVCLEGLPPVEPCLPSPCHSPGLPGCAVLQSMVQVPARRLRGLGAVLIHTHLTPRTGTENKRFCAPSGVSCGPALCCGMHLGKQQLFVAWSFPRQNLRQGLQMAICNSGCFCFLGGNLIGQKMSNNCKIVTQNSIFAEKINSRTH